MDYNTAFYSYLSIEHQINTKSNGLYTVMKQKKGSIFVAAIYIIQSQIFIPGNYHEQSLYQHLP